MNSSVKTLLSTNSLVLTSMGMFAPIYAIYVQQTDGNILDIGFAWSVYAFAAAVTTYGIGVLSDRFKQPKYLVALGYFIMGIGFLSYIYTQNILHIFISQSILGIGEAVYSPPFDSLFSNHTDAGKSGTQWGIWESINYLTIGAGSILGSFVVTFYGFNSLFILLASMCFISSLWIMLSKNV